MQNNLYSYYQSQGKTLPGTVEGRFADPNFAAAAKVAGVDPSTYSINANNADVNQKILAALQQGGQTNVPTKNLPTVTTPAETAGAAPNVGPQPTQVQPGNAPTSGMNPTLFTQYIDQLKKSTEETNSLVNMRAKLQQVMFDSGITEADKASLPKPIQDAINSGDSRIMGLQMRLINDQIAGRNNTLDQSVQYLTDGYKTSVQQAEEEKKNALTTILQIGQTYGDQAGAVIRSLYTPEQVNALKDMGIDINKLSSPKTVAQINNELDYNASVRNSGSGNGTSGGKYTSDLDALIGNAMNLISSKNGKQTFSDSISKARNDADKVNTLATTILANSPAPIKTAVGNQSIGIKQIDKAINAVKNGAKTGVIENGRQYIFNLFGKDADPALAQVKRDIIAAVQPYRNSVTGAAWGTQETDEYNQLFGGTQYSPEELLNRLNSVKQLMMDRTVGFLSSQVSPIAGTNVFDSNTSIPITGVTTSGIKYTVN